MIYLAWKNGLTQYPSQTCVCVAGKLHKKNPCQRWPDRQLRKEPRRAVRLQSATGGAHHVHSGELLLFVWHVRLFVCAFWSKLFVVYPATPYSVYVQPYFPSRHICYYVIIKTMSNHNVKCEILKSTSWKLLKLLSTPTSCLSFIHTQVYRYLGNFVTGP